MANGAFRTGQQQAIGGGVLDFLKDVLQRRRSADEQITQEQFDKEQREDKAFMDIIGRTDVDPQQAFQAIQSGEIPEGAQFAGTGKPSALDIAKTKKVEKETELLGASKSFSNKDKKEITAKFGETTLKNATTLRKEFNSAKAFKDFQVIERSANSIAAALEKAIDPNIKSRIAADQALGVLFQKMLDPDSVVRESEYARTPEGASLLNRMKAFVPKLTKGGLALTNDDRQALKDIADTLFLESKKTLNSHIERYEGFGSEYGVPRELIMGNIQPSPLEQTTTTPEVTPDVSVDFDAIFDKVTGGK